jgi:hypothetical protein
MVGPVQPINFPAGVLSLSRQERLLGEFQYDDVKAREASVTRVSDDEPIIPSEPLINLTIRESRPAWRDAADS